VTSKAMLCAKFVTEKESMLFGLHIYAYRIWFGNLRSRNNLEYMDVHERIILK
jgi:hypothetical protein